MDGCIQVVLRQARLKVEPFEFRFGAAEIEEQSYTLADDFEVGDGLRLMNREQNGHDLEFGSDFPCDEQVEPLQADRPILVEYSILGLPLAVDTQCPQVADHRALVDVLGVVAAGAIVDVVVDADEGAGGLFVQ